MCEITLASKAYQKMERPYSHARPFFSREKVGNHPAATKNCPM